MALARVIGLLVGLWLGLFGLAFGQELQPVPALSAHVTDTVGLLPDDRRQALESQLVQLEKDKGAQIAVLIVSTTQPEPVETYALRVAEAWRLGRKGVDDGVLFVVARDDRRMRIEVGYGLEGAVPDAIAKRIISDTVAPRFKAGDFPGGIEAGVAALIARINGEALPAPTESAGDPPMGMEEIVVVGIVFAIVVGSVLKLVFGRLLGSAIVAGVVGVGGWMITSALLVGLVGAVLAFIFSLAAGTGGGGRTGGGPWIGGGGFGGGSNSGGWSGGGGSFGGGGASGEW